MLYYTTVCQQQQSPCRIHV
uniref:Uncharacterized protein n=1 Tax=Anguilla anguilla TaxID=7936 RepID=A0A0E9RJ63_ANGAN